jgi:hypothetical protein
MDWTLSTVPSILLGRKIDVTLLDLNHLNLFKTEKNSEMIFYVQKLID